MNNDKERIARNKDLIERMKKGENLALIKPSQTFYPPRQTIKKDPELIKRVYDTAKKSPQK